MEAKQSDNVKVIKGGRKVRVGGTQVMGRENEEFGAFGVKADVTSGKVGDSGSDFKHSGARGCLHVCFCAHGWHPVEKAVSAAVVEVALHINALTGRRLCGSRVLIVTICDGIFQGTVEVWAACGDLSKIGISGTTQRVWEDEVKKNASGRGETFSFPDRGGGERDRKSGHGKDFYEVKGCWGGVRREQRL